MLIGVCRESDQKEYLGLGGSVLGNSLGSLRDGVLRKLTREKKSDGSLNFSGRKSLLLVVSDELDGLLSDSVKDIINERVHDTHGLLTDTSIRVDLLKDLEDVDTEVLSSLTTSGGLLEKEYMHI